MIDGVQQKFRDLRLKHCADNIASALEQADQKNLSILQTIDRLLDLEIDMRRQARIQLRFKQSRLLEQSTIDQFDFNHHVSRKNHKNTILGLLDLEFIRKKMDIILIGNPGVGKSFLAKIIAYAATQAGIATLFTSTMDMINQLVAAQDNHSLLNKLKTY
jgi:DNA replication protein DnaC